MMSNLIKQCQCSGDLSGPYGFDGGVGMAKLFGRRSAAAAWVGKSSWQEHHNGSIGMVREYVGRRGLIVGCVSDGASPMKAVSIAHMLLDVSSKI